MMLLTKKIVKPLTVFIVFGMISLPAFAVAETSDATGKASSTEIQKALTEAGFYKGSIDGVIGKKTKEAIRKFQESNGLKADGVCGTKTWEKLKAYSEEAAAMDATSAAATTTTDVAAATTPAEEDVTASTPALDETNYDYSEFDSTADSATSSQDQSDELKQKLVS